MLDDKLALIRAHRSNIHRYQRLLRTKLSQLERNFIERRMAEEKAALQALATDTFPLAFTLPNHQSAFAWKGCEA